MPELMVHTKYTLMAEMAACLVANVTKAQPLLWAFWSRSTVHSSIGPCFSKICRTSFSDSFLFSMPTNSLRSANIGHRRVNPREY